MVPTRLATALEAAEAVEPFKDLETGMHQFLMNDNLSDVSLTNQQNNAVYK